METSKDNQKGLIPANGTSPNFLFDQKKVLSDTNKIFFKDKFKEIVKDEPIGLMKPMRLEFSYGCLANSLSVNDIEEADLTDAQRRIVC